MHTACITSPAPAHRHHRHIELDLLRTLAVFGMVLYHAAYDLRMFYGWDIDAFSGGWWLLARGTANLFLLLVGASFALSWDRTIADQTFSRAWRKYLRRGAMVFACGVSISVATYLFDPATYVRFGILHLIGVGIALLPLFARFRAWNLVIGGAAIAAGFTVREWDTQTSLLLPLGITPSGFTSIDYFPLLPWFGVVLIGYALGYAVYVHRHFKSPLRCTSVLCQSLTWPGRHALPIYFLHQPVLLICLWMMSAVYEVLR